MTGTNDAPVANDDTAGGARGRDAIATGNLLANDTDMDTATC